MNPTTSGDCMAAANCNAVKIGNSTKIRYGRFMVMPAFGPETRDLGVTLEAQYYDGALFAKNGLDTCTTYALSQASLSNYSDNLDAGETSITDASSRATLVSGESNPSAPLLLSAPGIGNDGAVDVTLRRSRVSRIRLVRRQERRIPKATPASGAIAATTGSSSGRNSDRAADDAAKARWPAPRCAAPRSPFRSYIDRDFRGRSATPR